MQAEAKDAGVSDDGSGRERRRAPRLPEELEAVVTDSAVASALIAQLPTEQREKEISWVASARGREARARRAVDVVRHAIKGGPRREDRA